jgi:hypothetical protein
VLLAALRDAIEFRIGLHRALHEAGHGRALEVREVLAGQEPDEVGG